MGLEGLIVVNPHVPYKYVPLESDPMCFYKMKPKTVTKGELIKLTNVKEKEDWKDGEKEKVSEYTVTIGGTDTCTLHHHTISTSQSTTAH